jgi:hypothetical protein
MTMGCVHFDDSEAVATAPLLIRMAPKALAAIKAKAKRLNMSATAFFRYGAELALTLNDRALVRSRPRERGGKAPRRHALRGEPVIASLAVHPFSTLAFCRANASNET